MASGAFIVPNKAKLNVANATALLSLTSNWMLSLHTSTFSPSDGDAGNEVYGDLTNELANGNGYTTGGIALTGVALSGPASGVIKFTSNPAVWTASGTGIPAWRYAYLYNNATVNSKVKPILAHFVGDSTPADIPLTTAGNTLTVTMNASGILTLS